MTVLGSKISSARENESFVVSLIHLESRRESKEDYRKQEKARWGLDYRRVNRIMCSPAWWLTFLQGSGKENSSWHWKGVLTSNKDRAGLNLFLKKL